MLIFLCKRPGGLLFLAPASTTEEGGLNHISHHISATFDPKKYSFSGFAL
jgi:hypothetical protein